MPFFSPCFLFFFQNGLYQVSLVQNSGSWACLARRPNRTLCSAHFKLKLIYLPLAATHHTNTHTEKERDEQQTDTRCCPSWCCSLLMFKFCHHLQRKDVSERGFLLLLNSHTALLFLFFFPFLPTSYLFFSLFLSECSHWLSLMMLDTRLSLLFFLTRLVVKVNCWPRNCVPSFVL